MNKEKSAKAYDVVIIGGGVSGICAAISAARDGVKVCLIGNRPVLGGNSSSEIRMWTRGATGGKNFFSEEMGIIGELKLDNLYRNVEGNIYFWDELLVDFVLSEKNISLFLNTNVFDVDVVMDNESTIKAVKAYQLGSEKEYEFISPVFIEFNL